MFKVYRGAEFVVDVHAATIEDAVAIFNGLHGHKESRIIALARRMWQVGEFEMAQVMN